MPGEGRTVDLSIAGAGKPGDQMDPVGDHVGREALGTVPLERQHAGHPPGHRDHVVLELPLPCSRIAVGASVSGAHQR